MVKGAIFLWNSTVITLYVFYLHKIPVWQESQKINDSRKTTNFIRIFVCSVCSLNGTEYEKICGKIRSFTEVISFLALL